ncbi:inositol monophosphatase family protein [Microbacterium elymi]|uniref:Inositol-1-monophosphatase n=1 Tax=Microbacterium elymi TaxID=2909587 RepID=A0ABY5NI25_9MICO|nr:MULTISPECIES: inositol monophosphatase family protein [Microbacterium]UUT34849.1 inositol monophosphatase [Microbacterium elymi]
MTAPLSDPDDLVRLAADIAREAGALARRRRAEGVQIAATKSAVADIVTAADREVEALIRSRLAAERPADGFLGEESGAEPGSSGITWVVDPIDGTVNYAYGVPAYAVSIAAIEGVPDPATWQAIAGAVFGPPTGELFTAVRGGGAFVHVGDRDDDRTEPLRVNEHPGAAGALLATGFGYDPATHAGDLARLARVMPLARDIRRIGSAALDLAYVAAGRLDGYFERGLNPWDHAAGALIVEEAGGRVGGVPGGRPGKDLIIAAGPDLFAALQNAIDAR